MKLSGSKYDLMSALFILAGAVMFFLAIGQSHGSDNIQRTASTMSRVLDGRLDLLEEYMDRALGSDPGEWLDIGEVPGDMVIYRYRADTLQSWVNEFPISNDDIRTQMYVPVLANPRAYLVSPLSEVGDTAEFVNMGYRWYLVKSVEEDDVRVFGGIEILRTRGTGATANRVLHLKQGYEISELSEGSGVREQFLDAPQIFFSYEVLILRGDKGPLSRYSDDESVSCQIVIGPLCGNDADMEIPGKLPHGGHRLARL